MLHRHWLITLLCLTGLVAPVFGQDKDKALLKWKFEKGKTFYQKMTTATDQSMKVMGSDIKQTQSQTFIFSWTPDSEKDGAWTIKQKIEAVMMKIDIGGNQISYDSTKETNQNNPLSDFFKALVGSEFTITIAPDKDGRYKVTKIEGRKEFVQKLISANQQMEPLLNQILSEDALKEMADPTFGALPNKEVTKNDTWKQESTLNMGPIGKYNTTYTYTYEGKEKVGDKNLDKISLATDMKYTPPAENEAAAGLPFKIKKADLTTKNGKGTLYFDPDKGRVEKSEMSLDISGKLSIEIGGQTTDVDLSQTQKTTVETSDANPAAPAKKAEADGK